MVCLDTSFIIALLRREDNAEKELERVTVQNQRLSTTPITVCELFKGVYRSKNSANEAEKIKGLLTYLEILEFNVDACERYGQLINTKILQSSPIGDMDVMIAAIALTHNEPLITRNLRHFERIPDLSVKS